MIFPVDKKYSRSETLLRKKQIIPHKYDQSHSDEAISSLFQQRPRLLRQMNFSFTWNFFILPRNDAAVLSLPRQ
jgi:hypothetical protein